MKLKFLSNERFRKNVYKKYWYNKDLAFFFRGFHLYRSRYRNGSLEPVVPLKDRGTV